MIKTFILPYFPSLTWNLIGYITGIILAHSVYQTTECATLLLKINLCFLMVAALCYLFTNRTTWYLFLFLMAGFARTTFIFYNYESFTYKPKIPLEVTTVTQTGNPQWPFCTFLKHNSYNVLLYTKLRPACSTNDKCLSDLHFKKPAYNEFCRYLLKEEVMATAFSYHFKPKIITPASGTSIYDIREKINHSITSKLSYLPRALFTSLFLGNKKVVKKELKRIKLYFRSWGIVHHLARSGFHLIIVLLMWYSILSFIPISYFIKSLFISFIIAIFALFSFNGISFTRSLFIFFMTQFLLCRKQQVHTFYLLILAALLFLIINPFLIFGLDFQLSFFVAMLLCLFSLINRQKKVTSCKLLLKDYKKA